MRIIKSSTTGDYDYALSVVIDLVYDEEYDEYEIENAVADVLNSSGTQFISLEVYPIEDSEFSGEYQGETILECSAEFEYSGDYDEERIEYYLSDRLESLGYEVIQIFLEI